MFCKKNKYFFKQKSFFLTNEQPYMIAPSKSTSTKAYKNTDHINLCLQFLKFDLVSCFTFSYCYTGLCSHASAMLIKEATD